ncbi:MAG: rod shape-determining protein MreC, partial [Phaeobacter italicus]
VFPAGLLIGQVTQDRFGRLRVRLSADYERLEFLRVLRHHGSEVIRDPGGLIVPAPGTGTIPRPRPEGLGADTGDGTEPAETEDG